MFQNTHKENKGFSVCSTYAVEAHRSYGGGVASQWNVAGLRLFNLVLWVDQLLPDVIVKTHKLNNCVATPPDS